MSKPLIIFDWNGTILDDTDAAVHGANAVMKLFGKEPLGVDTFRQHYQVPLVNLYASLNCENYEARLLEINQTFFDVYHEQAQSSGLRDGANALLQAVSSAGVLSVVLSNHVVSDIDRRAQEFGIRGHFDAILANEDNQALLKKGKKHRIVDYLAACDKQPAHSYIVGDSVEEIEIGRDLGFTTIALTGGMSSLDRMQAAGPHHIAHSLHDMHEILRRDGVLP